MSAKLITTNDPDRIVKRIGGIPVRNRDLAEADRQLVGNKRAALLRDPLAVIIAAKPGWSDPKPVQQTLEEAA